MAKVHVTKGAIFCNNFKMLVYTVTEVCGFILGLKETPPVEDIISVTI